MTLYTTVWMLYTVPSGRRTEGPTAGFDAPQKLIVAFFGDEKKFVALLSKVLQGSQKRRVEDGKRDSRDRRRAKPEGHQFLDLQRRRRDETGIKLNLKNISNSSGTSTKPGWISTHCLHHTG
eukprot:gb/GECG01000598.1/.p1 GENE.gb/GECG01000598.1/~~gb/GECG01000598.1/.p1  ORF type:complete len:122 (+),score=13.54 gb/GECG01000598.1/:1-366(+)